MSQTETLLSSLTKAATSSLAGLYGLEDPKVEIQPTRKEFEGDFTLVVFPYLKASRKSPEATATEIGEHLVKSVEEISAFNVVKGFLNLSISDTFWINALASCGRYVAEAGDDNPSILVEYSSPNTNKPLHLGHIRNCLLGYSVSELLKGTGNQVIKAQIINDRGIHICKSMVAWLQFGNGETPLNPVQKGDHLVGKYYVLYERAYKVEIHSLKNVAKKLYESDKNAWKKTHQIARINRGDIETKKKLIIESILKSYAALLSFIYPYQVFGEAVFENWLNLYGLGLDNYFNRASRVNNKSNYENLDKLFKTHPVKVYNKIVSRRFDNLNEYKELLAVARYFTKYSTEENIQQLLSKFERVDSLELVTPQQVYESLNSKFNEYDFNTQNQYEIFRVIFNEFQKFAPIFQDAQKTLRLWESEDSRTLELWKKMNNWVYEGFEATYKALGVDFDKYYYESNTYLLGKEVIQDGLQRGIFYRKDDGSVWVDLTADGLDHKLLLRSDGTSVYMTQDIGTAIQRYEDFGIDGMIYTVGNEQDYHFKVLFLILQKLGYAWADHLHHLSYGMVDLPSGKMKSREGTVVDADDLIRQMEDTAKAISDELGKTEGMSKEEKQKLYHMLGMGALKYYILRVDPRKRMLFNPEESIDFQGNTGPFIQYTHARISSLLRKAGDRDMNGDYQSLQEPERNIIKLLTAYPQALNEAAENYSPAVLANYIYDLVKAYNALYQQLPILTDPDEGAVALRLQLSAKVAEVIKQGMSFLGIEVPERM